MKRKNKRRKGKAFYKKGVQVKFKEPIPIQLDLFSQVELKELNEEQLFVAPIQQSESDPAEDQITWKMVAEIYRFFFYRYLGIVKNRFSYDRLLQSWSYLIPTKYREAFIGDLNEMRADMKEQGCSRWWILAISIWHIFLAVKSSMKTSLKEQFGLESRSETQINK